jgi:hypothetical protein
MVLIMFWPSIIMLLARGEELSGAGIRRWIHTQEGGSTCRGAQGEGRQDAVMLMVVLDRVYRIGQRRGGKGNIEAREEGRGKGSVEKQKSG